MFLLHLISFFVFAINALLCYLLFKIVFFFFFSFSHVNMYKINCLWESMHKQEAADFKARFDNFGAGSTRAKGGFDRKAPQRRAESMRSEGGRSAAEEFYERRKTERDTSHFRSASVDGHSTRYGASNASSYPSSSSTSNTSSSSSSSSSSANTKNMRSPVQAFPATATHYTVLGVEHVRRQFLVLFRTVSFSCH
jgi:hypothetical protein